MKNGKANKNENFNVVLGVSGGIAAYKACEILRLLQKHGCDVRVIATENATKFVGISTLEALSGHNVATDMFGNHAVNIDHIAWAKWQDLLLIAPATANIIGKMANGIADDFLTTHFLASSLPIVFAPAMNVRMWENPAVIENIKNLQSRGMTIITPEKGYLACGDIDEGRLAEEEAIINIVMNLMNISDSLSGKRVVVTAGPTREFLDPIRFISNPSSGKMGYALAREAALRGAAVTLISGPTHLSCPYGVKRISIFGADQMAVETLEATKGADLLLMAAAVSDYAPSEIKKQKIKKGPENLDIHLHKTRDILMEISKRKGKKLILIGFAAESEYLLENAIKKMKTKNLNGIAANLITDQDIGFEAEENQVTLLFPNEEPIPIPKQSKQSVATIILDSIIKRYFQ